MIQLPQTKVLVTGGSGFLGSHLCRYLSSQSCDVHAITRTANIHSPNGSHWWEANVEDLESIRKVFVKVRPDIVFHMSGLVSAGQTMELVLPTFHSLLTSTVNVLTVATEIGCKRIILVGSLNEPRPELGESFPTSPYGAAKWAGSAYGRMFHALYQTPVVIVRPFMTYGPGQDKRKLIPYVILSILEGQSPKLSSGEWEADWIFIDDVIEGFTAAALVPNIEGKTLDLGSGSLVAVREVVGRVVQLLETDNPPLFGEVADRVFEPARKANVTQTFETLGWKPKITLEEGIQQTVEWYRTQFAASSMG